MGLLFGAMVTLGASERNFLQRTIPRVGKSLDVRVDADAVWEQASPSAKRAWAALHFSGSGVVKQSLTELFRAQRDAGEAPSLEGIFTFDGFTRINKVRLARATALATKLAE